MPTDIDQLADQTRRLLCKLEDEVIPSIHGVKTQLEILNLKNAHAETENNRLTAEVKSHTQILLGDGDKSSGLVGRTNKVEEWIATRSAYEKLVFGLAIAEIFSLFLLVARLVFTTPLPIP